MHHAAFSYVARFRDDSALDVLDIGGRDINGSCRPLFPHASYLAVDLHDGPGVDIVADVADWRTRKRFDLVICTEVFEHTHAWPALVAAAYRVLRKNGRLVATCAGPGRAPHSALDGGYVRHGEWYENVQAEKLAAAMAEVGFVDITVNEVGEDVQGTGVKP